MCDFSRFCCELIQESVILLRLPQIVACTGQCIFHNFQSKREKGTSTLSNALSISMACGFLASKVEERMRLHLMRDFMKVFNYMYFKRAGETKIPELELGGYVRETRNLKTSAHTSLVKISTNTNPLINIAIYNGGNKFFLRPNTDIGTPDGRERFFIQRERFSRRWDSMYIR